MSLCLFNVHGDCPMPSNPDPQKPNSQACTPKNYSFSLLTLISSNMTYFACNFIPLRLLTDILPTKYLATINSFPIPSGSPPAWSPAG